MSRRRPLLFCLLAAFVARLSASAESLQMEQIAPGVYVHQGVHQLPDRQNRGEIANIGFIVGQRCVAVIDTGGSPDQGYLLRAAIEQATTLPICFVINTHVHPDHIYGNRAFKRAGTKFVGHHKLGQAMAMRAPYYMAKAVRDLGLNLLPEDFIPPDVTVRDTLDLDLGGRTISIKAHPTAHTDSDLSIFDPETQTLWLSDLLFLEHIPVVDGSLNGWIGELERLKNVPARRAVPGHGPVASGWPAALQPEERYLKMLQKEVRSALRERKTIERAMDSVGESARTDWQLFGEFHKRNIATVFAELEWEDD